VYISRDVVFDDGVYPLSKLNPDAGTRLQSEIFLLPSQYQPLSLPGHGGEISNFSSACVPINPGATNGICSFEVAVENSGSDHGELQEISHMQEDGSEPAMGLLPVLILKLLHCDLYTLLRPRIPELLLCLLGHLSEPYSSGSARLMARCPRVGISGDHLCTGSVVLFPHWVRLESSPDPLWKPPDLLQLH
jgi:hypothetical protein